MNQFRTHVFTLATIFALGFSLEIRAASVIHGAGATFPAPIYAKWFSEFNKLNPNVKINYQSIGSGGGITQFVGKTVDFGATDAPMSDDQLKQAAAGILHFPTVLGAVVVTYNLEGVDKGLKLPKDVLADIYLGKITQWNDPRITKPNPGVNLPSKPILVVRRSDGSGTTFIFTQYLASISSTWKDTVGSSTSVKWPTGIGGKGNEGVTGMVKQTPGAIGYVELLYAESNKLPYAAVENLADEYVLPTLNAVTAAAQAAKLPDDFRVSLVNLPGKGVYPISGATYLLVWKDLAKGEKTSDWLKFLRWSLKDGQKKVSEMHYAPLPAAWVTRAEKAVNALGTPSAKDKAM